MAKPHSLSYQADTFAILPSTTLVNDKSTIEECGSWLKSEETSCSSLVSKIFFNSDFDDFINEMRHADVIGSKHLDDVAKIGEEEILKRCGNALTSQAVGPKILWFRRNYPDLFKKTHKILTSTSFLVHRLTNEYVIDHYTAANFSPLYDVYKQNWTIIKTFRVGRTESVATNS